MCSDKGRTIGAGDGGREAVHGRHLNGCSGWFAAVARLRTGRLFRVHVCDVWKDVGQTDVSENCGSSRLNQTAVVVCAHQIGFWPGAVWANALGRNKLAFKKRITMQNGRNALVRGWVVCLGRRL